YSADGKTLAALRNFRYWTPETTTVLVWDVATGAARAGAEQGPLDEVSAVALSPDGRTVASVSYEPYSGVGTVSLSHAATGQLLRTLPAKRLILRPLVFSPDGKHLFVGAGDGITRWEVATGREAGRYPADIWFMHLTDDGRTLRGALHSSSG